VLGAFDVPEAQTEVPDDLELLGAWEVPDALEDPGA